MHLILILFSAFEIALSNATSSLMEYVSILIEAGASVNRGVVDFSPPLVDIVIRAGISRPRPEVVPKSGRTVDRGRM